MRLIVIAEGFNNHFRNQITAALKGEGKGGRGGIYGVMDEFNISYERAQQYVGLLDTEVDDRVLLRIRAPQNLLKLLRYLNVSRSVINKLIAFHVKFKKVVDKHKSSPDDHIVIQELEQGERLAGLVGKPLKEIERAGLVATIVPWFEGEFKTHYPSGVWYINYPEHQDVVDEILQHQNNVCITDILHGLAFGYPMVSVFEYVRHYHRDIVDQVCGHVDDLPRN